MKYLLGMLPLMGCDAAESTGPAGAWGDGAGPYEVGAEADTDAPDVPDAVALEDCMDGVDNDADGDEDCADDDCGLHHACSECWISAPGTCNTQWIVLNDYPHEGLSGALCGVENTGPETVFEFTVIRDQEVSVTVRPEKPTFGMGGNDVSLYLVEDTCFAEHCVAVSEAGGRGVDEGLVFTAEAGRFYYLVVEQRGPDVADMEFETVCADPS